MQALKIDLQAQINSTVADLLNTHFSPADAATLRAEENLGLGALAYYGQQQALIQAGVFLFTPSMRDLCRDFLENTLDMLQAEENAINEQAGEFEYARLHEME